MKWKQYFCFLIFALCLLGRTGQPGVASSSHVDLLITVGRGLTMDGERLVAVGDLEMLRKISNSRSGSMSRS